MNELELMHSARYYKTMFLRHSCVDILLNGRFWEVYARGLTPEELRDWIIKNVKGAVIYRWTISERLRTEYPYKEYVLKWRQGRELK